MKRYRVMIDYTNFIPIGEHEVEKAVMAMASNGKAFFEQGATDRIHAIIPDFHAMMGWNYGYKLEPEDYAEIASSKECHEAKALLADIKARLAGAQNRPELHEGVKQIARAKSEPTYDR